MKMGDLPIDRELASLMRDIRKISPATKDFAKSPENELIDLQSQLLDAHVEFMSVHEVIGDQQKEVNNHTTATADSLLYWNGIVLEKLLEVYERQNQLFRRQLWIGILTARLNFFEGFLPRWVEDEEALMLGQRRSVQERAESSLAKRINTAKQRGIELARQLSEILVGIANRDAAGSLDSYFGEGMERPWEHPYMVALKMYLKKATLPVRLGPRYFDLLRDSQALGLKKAEMTVRVKRGLFSRFARKGASRVDIEEAGSSEYSSVDGSKAEYLVKRQAFQDQLELALGRSPENARLRFISDASPLRQALPPSY